MIYTDDHAPAHTHVWYQGREMTIEFEGEVIVRENPALNRNEERRALAIVGERQTFFQVEWRRIYGQS